MVLNMYNNNKKVAFVTFVFSGFSNQKMTFLP
ncbi:hypothetical protein TSAR_003134 [Trichomalopsis sarcophagae]|uniref:Uncharacterized protein n=1 Tax=Trichomalopsis sarcophagae TaxID=543379 RepID=A0A232FGM1_9HYME|nr:hypothetical protein TSAR_003134 [Trichomalopsis sarcophagae]